VASGSLKFQLGSDSDLTRFSLLGFGFSLQVYSALIGEGERREGWKTWKERRKKRMRGQREEGQMRKGEKKKKLLMQDVGWV
jgi:hypothetical protein